MTTMPARGLPAPYVSPHGLQHGGRYLVIRGHLQHARPKEQRAVAQGKVTPSRCP
jgi:hypothetical protein